MKDPATLAPFAEDRCQSFSLDPSVLSFLHFQSFSAFSDPAHLFSKVTGRIPMIDCPRPSAVLFRNSPPHYQCSSPFLRRDPSSRRSYCGSELKAPLWKGVGPLYAHSAFRIKQPFRCFTPSLAFSFSDAAPQGMVGKALMRLIRRSKLSPPGPE